MAVENYFENAGVPLLLVDLAQVILRVNRAARELIGPECSGQPIRQFYSEPSHWDDCLETGSVETTVLCGTDPLRVTSKTCRDGDETLVTWIVHEVRDMLSGLHEILSGGGDVGYLFSRLTPFLHERIPYARCSLAIWHDDIERFEVYSHTPDGLESTVDHRGVYLDEDALGTEVLLSMRNSDLVIRQNLSAPVNSELTQLSGVEIQSTAYAPLHYERRFLGALNLGRARPNVWTTHDEELLRSIIGPLGLAVAVTLLIRDLQASERKYRELYEEAPLMYHTIDSAGRILDCNRREAEVLGYTKQELLGMRIADLMTDRSREEFQETLEIVRTDQPEMIQAEREFKCKDGTVLYTSLTSTILYDEQGVIIGARTIMRDITEQKLIQQRLLQTQKLEGLGTMVAGITHEFNNLLGPILGYSQMLQRRAKDSDPSEELGQIEIAARKARDILQSLLRFTRQSKLQKKYIDLQNVIKSTPPLVKARAIAKNVTISMDFPDELPWTRVDDVQMSQLFINLLNNAIDACPREGGKVLITVSHTATWIQILVKDTGHGIDEQTMPYLFDPFFTTKPAGEGTGLGLATCFGILSDHDGSIQAFNSDIDGIPGACFEVLLPIRRHPTHQIRRAKTTEEVTVDLRQRRVLVVEDDLRYNNMICDLLESRGAEVRSALDGRQASKLLGDGDAWDLVVADIRMPLMDGFELHAWVEEHRPDLVEHLLFITGDTMDKKTQDFLGRDDIQSLNKPFEVHDFYRSVRDVSLKV